MPFKLHNTLLRVSVLLLALYALGTQAQLSGRVGPTTSRQSKRSRICNVLDYGGSIGSSDIGPAIGRTFTECVRGNPGSTLYVPQGNYNMQTWQSLNGAKQWAFQMDGIITRTGTSRGHMIIIHTADDFEMYSSNSAGAFQGNGHQLRNNGPRFLRMVRSTNFAVHDLIFVNSPEFHVIVEEGSNGELYNLIVRGADIGGSDGINVWGTNHWIHDVSITNRDECVCVKSPASNILVERVWCNQSGGSAIGSLGSGTQIQNIVYRNVYTNGGNQAFMIKSNGGSGFVRNVLFENFKSRGTAYGLNVQQYWDRQTPAEGAGVQLSNITFRNWNGDVADGIRRPPIQFFCADGAPCRDLVLDNVNMWSQTNQATNKCQSAYGRGGSCLRSGSGGSYGTVTTTISRPPGYTSSPTMAGDLSQGYATNSPIPIPTIPMSFFPGLPQISPLMKNQVGSSSPTTTQQPTPTPSPGGVQVRWGQCGGNGYTGPTQCESGTTCVDVSPPWYSQCL